MQNNRTTTSESSENTNQAEDSRWEYNPFHCSWERHLYQMKSALAAPLYSWGRGLSYKSDSFHPSIENIARHFGCDRTTVIRALDEMAKCGWAEVIHKEPGKPVAYRFIDHEEWEHAHPDKCVVKDEIPGSSDGDQLGCKLHSISGGLAKFYPNQMTGLRKSGLSDDQIVTEFRAFLDHNSQKGKARKGVYYPFLKHLLGVADDLRDAENAANSSSGVSHRSDTYQSHRSDTYQSHRSDTPSRTEATPTSRTGATQVFEFSPEVVLDGRHDTRPALQGRPASEPTNHEVPGKGTSSPSETHPLDEQEKKETSPAQARSSQEPSPEWKVGERKAYYEDQLAKVEKLIAGSNKGSKAVENYRELKVHLERKIAEYSKEEVVAA